MKKLAMILTLCVGVMSVSAQGAEMTIKASQAVSATYYYHITDPVTWAGNYFGQDVMTFWKFSLADLIAEAPAGGSIQIDSATFVVFGESTYPSTILPGPTQTLYETSSVWTPNFKTYEAPALGDVIGTYNYPGGFTGAYLDCKNYLQSTLDSDASLISFGGYGPSAYIDDNDKRILRFVGLGYGYDDHYAPHIAITYTVVPEPFSLITLALGGLALVRRKK